MNHSDPTSRSSLLHTVGESLARYAVAWSSAISYSAIVLIVLVTALFHFHLLPLHWADSVLGGTPRWTDSIMLVLLIAVLEQVISISANQNQEPPLKAFPASQQAYADLATRLEGRPAQNVDMIQFSGFAATHLLQRLGETSPGAQVRILLQHPQVASQFDRDSVSHKSNIQATHTHLFVGLEGKVRVSLRYYRSPASMSAILVDEELLAIGWYRHFHDQDGHVLRLRGHNVAALVVTGAAGHNLRHLAREHFDAIWNTAEPAPEPRKHSAIA